MRLGFPCESPFSRVYGGVKIRVHSVRVLIGNYEFGGNINCYWAGWTDGPKVLNLFF